VKNLLFKNLHYFLVIFPQEIFFLKIKLLSISIFLPTLEKSKLKSFCKERPQNISRKILRVRQIVLEAKFLNHFLFRKKIESILCVLYTNQKYQLKIIFGVWKKSKIFHYTQSLDFRALTKYLITEKKST